VFSDLYPLHATSSPAVADIRAGELDRNDGGVMIQAYRCLKAFQGGPGSRSYAVCLRCGAAVVVDVDPNPAGISLSGEGLALTCLADRS
jgi:hypothetical protein